MTWYKEVSEEKDLGTFDVPAGATLRVTDPCYEKLVWCAGWVPKAKGGKWHGIVEYSEGDWGRRVAYLNAQHEDFLRNPSQFDGPFEETFEVAVDSGQAGVFVDEFYPSSHLGDYDDKESFYGRCCEGTLSRTHAVVLREGVVSSSGFGDGGYAAQTWKDSEGNVVAVRIDFGVIDDPEDEEEEDDEIAILGEDEDSEENEDVV